MSLGVRGSREVVLLTQTYGRWYSSMPWRDGRLMARIESVIHVADAKPLRGRSPGSKSCSFATPSLGMEHLLHCLPFLSTQSVHCARCLNLDEHHPGVLSGSDESLQDGGSA